MNLSEEDREELRSIRHGRRMTVGQVRRAPLILLLDEGASHGAIMNELRGDSRFIPISQTRFASEHLAGLYGGHPGRAQRGAPARLEARVLAYTLRHKPAYRSAHWSSRKLAAQLGVYFMSVQPYLAQARHSAASSRYPHGVQRCRL